MEVFHLLPLLGFGFIIGFKHALEADHIAAIATISSSTKSIKSSCFVGILWGLGHTISLLSVALFIFALKITFPHTLTLYFELAVGVMLFILGFDLIRTMATQKAHIHIHTHDGAAHSHFHSHGYSTFHHHIHRSFFVGLIHGLAGSAAVLLLIASAIHSLSVNILFIIMFGIGSMLGMLFVGAFITIPFLLAPRFTAIDFSLKIFSGLVSIAIGIFTVYQIGFVDGLLI